MHPLISCVDGRCTRPVLGTPGGSLGELVHTVAGLESFTWSPTPAAQLQGWMTRIATEIAPVYHHTDALGWDRATDGIPMKQTDEAAFVRALADMDNPAVHGCGHLAGMIQDPAVYKVRRALVVGLIRTFFELWRAGTPNVKLEIFSGLHEECEVLIDPSERPPLALPHNGSQSRFVIHPTPARRVRHAMATLIATDVGMDPTGLIEAADAACARMGALTLERLADGLPRVGPA
jgi:hypothetical protein